MLTLITNAEVFAPEPLGRRDLLLAGSQIAAIGEQLELDDARLGTGVVERIDADGSLLVPGFIDALCHPCGGGGEGGFGNRTGEMNAADFIRAGVTCPVGALGTDSITRSLDVLYGSVMQLRAAGLAAQMYTGAYRVPAPTLTGDVARDLALVEPVIGVGEVAVSDHRSSQPTVQELRRLAADSRLGGILSGVPGTVLVHVGDGAGGLAPLRDALADSDLPAASFYPTHVNRSTALLDEAAAFSRQGAWVDITVCTTPELIAAGDIPARAAFRHLLNAGAPADRITLSSDAGGSLPVYVDGELRGLTAATPDCLLELVGEVLREDRELLPLIVAGMTANPAAALGFNSRGRIEAGLDADLLILDSDGALEKVFCQGHRLL